MSSPTGRVDQRADLTADLLHDLGRPTPLPSAPPLPPLPEVPTVGGTPCLSVRLTPLHWTMPGLEGAEHGTGLAARIGPWRIEVSF